MTPGEPHNSAIVEFSTPKEAQAAVIELDGQEIERTVIKVMLLDENGSGSKSTVSQSEEDRQLSPGPALGELKFGKQGGSIFQPPPGVGLKLTTEKSTSSTNSSNSNPSEFKFDLPECPRVLSSQESVLSDYDSDSEPTPKLAEGLAGKTTPKSLEPSTPKSLDTFSFSLPDDNVTERTRSNSASFSQSSPQGTSEGIHRISSECKSFGTRSNSVSPTWKPGQKSPYRKVPQSLNAQRNPRPSQSSKRAKNTQEVSKTHRHHPYKKNLSPKPSPQQGGKSKHVTSQTSSADNPFLKELEQKRDVTTTASSSVGSLSQNPPIKDFRTQQTKSIPLSDVLVCRLLTAHPRVVAELQTVCRECAITCSLTNDCSSLALSGFQIDLEKSEEKIVALVKLVEQEIRTQTLAKHCMFIPFLVTVEAAVILDNIASKHSVEIDISLPSGKKVSPQVFADQYNVECGGRTSLLRTEELKNLTSTSPLLEPEGSASWSSLLAGISATYTAEDSAIIEHIYRYGGRHVRLNESDYTFNFFQDKAEEVYQIELKNDNKLPVMRSPPLAPNSSDDSAAPVYMISLVLRGLPDGIEAAEREISQQLQQVICDYEDVCEIPQNFHERVICLMLNYARQFCIRLKPIISKENGHFVVKFESISGYGEKVKLELQKYLLELQQDLLRAHAPIPAQLQQHAYGPDASQFPAEWDLEHSFPLKEVSPESAEWAEVFKELRKTMPSVKLTNLHRIQNKQLWQKYAIERQHMWERNSGEINEKQLFHGTRDNDPIKVVESEKGIDFRYSSEGRLLWGKGAYFAANASYSDKYSFSCENGEKQMLLVKVLTGKSYQNATGEYHQEWKLPPPLNPVTNKLYDTVTAFTGGSQVYVVYDHDKSYPAYLITYH